MSSTFPPSPPHNRTPSAGRLTALPSRPIKKPCWSTVGRNNTLYAYSLPDLTLIGGAALGGKGANWLTISPDDKTAYVANPQTNDVSVVDIKSLKEVARIPVGFAPSRNTAWLTP